MSFGSFFNKIDWGNVLGAVAHVLPLLGAGLTAVLHITGNDQHKTVAGEIAGALVDAGQKASQVDRIMRNGAAPLGSPVPPGSIA